MPSLGTRVSKHGKRRMPEKMVGVWAHDEASGAADERDLGEVSEWAGSTRRPLTEEERREMVAKAAYYISEKRGFNSGDELADWFAAEEEIARMLGEIGR